MLNETRSIEMETYLQAYLATGFFMGSVLIARAGEVLLNQSYGMANLEHGVPNSHQTKFRIGSVTKPFTAMAILKLQEQGLLNVRDSISNYIPDYPNGDRITVHQLLTHTAGIRNFIGSAAAEDKQHLKVTIDELISWFSDRPRIIMAMDGLLIVTLDEIVKDIMGQSMVSVRLFLDILRNKWL
jgi:CubicO group peptidase (beta-lactamase class C family)